MNTFLYSIKKCETVTNGLIRISLKLQLVKDAKKFHFSNFACIFTPYTFPEKANHFFILFVKGLEVLPLVLGGVTIIFLIDNFDEYVLINV